MITIVSCRHSYRSRPAQSIQPAEKVMLSRQGKDYNYCKELKEDVLLYFVFVDNGTEARWNEFSMVDKQKQIDTAVNWINNEALKNGVSVNIKTSFFAKGDSIIAIQNKMKHGSIYNSLQWSEKGVTDLQRWAQNVSDAVYGSIIAASDQTQSNSGLDRLVAHIQNTTMVSNVGVVFLKSAPVKEDISIVLNSKRDPIKYKKRPEGEFAIITDNHRPSVIAHEILHLFGAEDFYSSGYSLRRFTKKEIKSYKLKSPYAYFPSSYSNKTYLLREYPNSIMRNIVFDDINDLEVSPVTQYLIGWRSEKELSTKQKEFLLYGDYIELE